MTSAVGPFAVDAGLVATKDSGDMTVRIRNTNTGKLIDAKFAIANAEASPYGSFSIDGVEGAGAPVELAFLNPAGSRTGALLPTGNAVDVIDGIKVSLVDCGNPCCFVSAAELSIDGDILPDEVERHPSLLPKLDAIRRKASVMMGLSEDMTSVAGSIPKIALISRASTHELLSGKILEQSDIDLKVRAISVGQPHRAVPITVAMAVAAAAKIPGSIVHSIKGAVGNISSTGLTLGHPSGKIVVGAHFDSNGSVTNATVYRTARRLMDGLVYWK